MTKHVTKEPDREHTATTDYTNEKAITKPGILNFMFILFYFPDFTKHAFINNTDKDERFMCETIFKFATTLRHLGCLEK